MAHQVGVESQNRILRKVRAKRDPRGQMGKLRSGEVKRLARRHPDDQKQSPGQSGHLTRCPLPDTKSFLPDGFGQVKVKSECQKYMS